MTMVLEISSFVGGDEVRGGTSFDFVRPQDERLVGRIVEAGAEGVEAAVQVAATAFRARKSAVHQRIEWLKSAAVALAAEADEVAQIICEDVGKPIRSCRFEVRRHRQTGTCGRTYSCEIGSSVPGGEVAQGSFTVATGDKLTAAELVAHPEVRAVSFMGGTSGGDALARAAGAKKFVAELGSNAANIVLADADLDDAAKRIASAAFEASGQQCISAQRILVDRRSLDSFLAKFVNSAKALKVGRADDPMTDIGRMVSRASADRVMAMCDDAVAKGASYVLAPHQDGALVTPGVLSEVPFEARLWKEEVFGPVVLVLSFDGHEEALRLANDSPFGLQGSVFTRDLRSALQFTGDFAVGALWINEASRFRLDLYPSALDHERTRRRAPAPSCQDSGIGERYCGTSTARYRAELALM